MPRPTCVQLSPKFTVMNTGSVTEPVPANIAPLESLASDSITGSVNPPVTEIHVLVPSTERKTPASGVPAYTYPAGSEIKHETTSLARPLLEACHFDVSGS